MGEGLEGPSRFNLKPMSPKMMLIWYFQANVDVESSYYVQPNVDVESSYYVQPNV